MKGLRRRTASKEAISDRLQFQVFLQLAATEPSSPEALEDALLMARETLVEDAAGLALGPAGGVDFTNCVVELEFTVEAVSPAVFYAKMGEVLRVLERSGFEFESSKEERISPNREPELQPAL